jgi:hypothetical protein
MQMITVECLLLPRFHKRPGFEGQQQQRDDLQGRECRAERKVRDRRTAGPSGFLCRSACGIFSPRAFSAS